MRFKRNKILDFFEEHEDAPPKRYLSLLSIHLVMDWSF